MNIEELLNKYFDGDTTCEEERELRRFFTQGIVPEHLEIYRPMFAFFEKENQEAKTANPVAVVKQSTFRRRLLYTLSGIAAGLMILLGIAGIYQHTNALPQNYVIIDGQCFTDENLVREEAMAAFNDVSFTEDEILQTLLND